MASNDTRFAVVRILTMVGLITIGVLLPLAAIASIFSYKFLNNYDKFSDGSPTYYLVNLAIIGAGVLATASFLALKRMRRWFFWTMSLLVIGWYVVSLGSIGLPGKVALAAHPAQEILLLLVLNLFPVMIFSYLIANRSRFNA